MSNDIVKFIKKTIVLQGILDCFVQKCHSEYAIDYFGIRDKTIQEIDKLFEKSNKELK